MAVEPTHHQFVVSLAETAADITWPSGELITLDATRRYAERVVMARLHQQMFRVRVLDAYQSQCCICRLRHSQLLDAAHIASDAQGGQPVVSNGLSLCKIHHAAYDTDLVGISPDYRVAVRPGPLDEIDGPTLKHAIQGLHGATLTVPRQRTARPDRELLDLRYQSFLAAG